MDRARAAAARARMKANIGAAMGEIEDIGSVSFLVFKDPDGNLLMVCQRNN